MDAAKERSIHRTLTRIEKRLADCKRYAAALDEIAARGCCAGWKPIDGDRPDAPKQSVTCRMMIPDCRERWCPECIAADAREWK